MYALSWYANPWGNYGRTGFWILGDARQSKSDFLDKLPPGELPETLVLGSSNTMRYRPSIIEEGLGLSAFNYCVYWGKAEDVLCIVRHVVLDLDHTPKLLVIGVDPWTFAPPGSEHPLFPGVRRRLLNTPQLVRHLPDVSPLGVAWACFADAFSRQQLELSWNLVWGDKVVRTVRQGMVENAHTGRDGTRLYYGDFLAGAENIFESVEEGAYRLGEELAAMDEVERRQALDKYVSHYDFDAYWERRIGYMQQALQLCQDHRIDIVFVINPVHPALYDLLAKETPHVKNLQKLNALLVQFGQQYPNVVGTIDAARIDSFGGDPDGFYDPMHPATRNCDLILAQVIELVGHR